MGRTAPTFNAYTKNAEKSAFFIFSEYVGTAVPNLALRGFLKKPLKNPQKLRSNTHFISAKLLKFQETFLEKFLVSGFGADAPTFNAHAKNADFSAFFLAFQAFILPFSLSHDTVSRRVSIIFLVEKPSSLFAFSFEKLAFAVSV